MRAAYGVEVGQGSVCCSALIVDCVCEKGGSLEPSFSYFRGRCLPLVKVDAEVAEEALIKVLFEKGITVFLGA